MTPPANAANAAVFLSYASQDAEAARRLAEALRAAGVEVWFDQNELQGGDAWDAKIRRQIAECALFVPVISAATQARLEGYFRIEWKLAAQRTHAMADEKTFVLPVVIDATKDAEAKVPAEFKAVQWTRLPGGEGAEKFCARVAAVLGQKPAVSVPESLDKTKLQTRSPQAGFSKRLAWSLTGGLVMVAMLAWLWPKSESAANLAAVEETEATRLVAKARVFLENTEQSEREFETAALIAQQAIKMDPLDAETWAVSAEIGAWRRFYLQDRANELQEQVRREAAKAVALAPASFNARRAQASYFTFVAGKQAEEGADRILSALLKERPDDGLSLQLYARRLSVQGRYEEAIEVFRRLSKQPKFTVKACSQIAWLMAQSMRLAEAEGVLDQSLALEAFTSNVSLKVFLAMDWRGDPDLALATLKRLPAEVRLDDRALAAAIRVYLWRREPDELISLLKSVPRDWVQWSVRGPKAAFSGDAHAMAGRMELARQDWQRALGLVDTRLAATPDDRELLEWRVYLLAALGRPDEARAARVMARQLPPPTYPALGHHRLPLLETPEEILATLREEIDSPRLSLRPPLPGQIRLSPRYDRVRGLPEFAALLAESERRFGAPSQPSLNNSRTSPPDEKAVAVLPFANLSGDKEQEYFSDGLTEEILNALARERDLRVPGRTSSFSFKGKNASTSEIARALGVAQLVEGSVQRAGTRVRIRVSLTRASDGFSEELGTFTEELTDIFALQDKVAGAVVQKLTRRAPVRKVAVLTTNTEAYDVFLRARALQILSARGAEASIPLYRRAVELDPQFALAWANLAQATFKEPLKNVLFLLG